MSFRRGYPPGGAATPPPPSAEEAAPLFPPAIKRKAACRAVDALCPSAGGAIRAEKATSAFSHEVWKVTAKGGTFALKIARVHAGPQRVAGAVSAAGLAAEAGLPVPRILATDDGALLGRPLFIEEWVAGQDAASAWPTLTPVERDSVMRDLGRALARLHALHGPRFGTVAHPSPATDWRTYCRGYLAEYADGVARDGLLPPTDLARVTHRLEEGIAAVPAVIPSLCHWDLWLANVMVRDGAFAGLIDWESAGFADPLMDFVRLECWVFEGRPETRAPFREGYGPLPPDAESRLSLCRGLEYLAELYRHTRFGLADEAARFRERLLTWERAG